MKRKRTGLPIDRGLSAVLLGLCATALSGCVWLGRGAPDLQPGPEWEPRTTVRLTTKELWKEHNGGDQIYIHNGCLLETIKGYRHQSQPWSMRISTFTFKTPDGAKAIFDYYYEGIENEVKGVEPVGDATYMWKSNAMRSWIVGFRKGRRFVEVSLTEENDESEAMSDMARNKTIEIAGDLAVKL